MARLSGYDGGRLCKRLNVSRRQLERYTQRLFGQTPRDWLNHQRLHEAGDSLKNVRSVKEVAFSLGFKQVSHFSRAFKLQYGLSPTAFLASADLQIASTSVSAESTAGQTEITNIGGFI